MGKPDILPLIHSQTPQPIFTNVCKHDCVMDIYNYAKFHHDPSRGVLSPYTSVCACRLYFYLFFLTTLHTDSYAQRVIQRDRIVVLNNL